MPMTSLPKHMQNTLLFTSTLPKIHYVQHFFGNKRSTETNLIMQYIMFLLGILTLFKQASQARPMIKNKNKNNSLNSIKPFT